PIFGCARMRVLQEWGDAERRASADSDDGLPRALGTQRASNHRGGPRRATAGRTGPHLAAASGRYLRDLPHAPGVPRSIALPASAREQRKIARGAWPRWDAN